MASGAGCERQRQAHLRGTQPVTMIQGSGLHFVGHGQSLPPRRTSGHVAETYFAPLVYFQSVWPDRLVVVRAAPRNSGWRKRASVWLRRVRQISRFGGGAKLDGGPLWGGFDFRRSAGSREALKETEEGAG